MQSFAHIGETLRRLRKELGKTLEEIGAEANLGRGQLSRIENSRQEATLSTLAKILASQGISRKEFFRRYDLVEAEALALRKGRDTEAAEMREEGAAGVSSRSPELQELVGRLGSLVRAFADSSTPTAQGAVEVGEFVLTFKVMPKSQLSVSSVTSRKDVAEPDTSLPQKRTSRKRRTPPTP